MKFDKQDMFQGGIFKEFHFTSLDFTKAILDISYKTLPNDPHPYVRFDVQGVNFKFVFTKEYKDLLGFT